MPTKNFSKVYCIDIKWYSILLALAPKENEVQGNQIRIRERKGREVFS